MSAAGRDKQHDPRASRRGDAHQARTRRPCHAVGHDQETRAYDHHHQAAEVRPKIPRGAIQGDQSIFHAQARRNRQGVQGQQGHGQFIANQFCPYSNVSSFAPNKTNSTVITIKSARHPNRNSPSESAQAAEPVRVIRMNRLRAQKVVQANQQRIGDHHNAQACAIPPRGGRADEHGQHPRHAVAGGQRRQLRSEGPFAKRPVAAQIGHSIAAIGREPATHQKERCAAG